MKRTIARLLRRAASRIDPPTHRTVGVEMHGSTITIHQEPIHLDGEDIARALANRVARRRGRGGSY